VKAPLTFPSLDALGVPHVFTLRQDRIETTLENAGAILALHQFDFRHLVQAEQTHGNLAALVDSSHRGSRIPHADALITRDPTVTLVIRVADCGPIYFYDPIQQVVGLAHSGRKGTELGIAAATVSLMQQEAGSNPADLIAVLGPSIRTPDYDIDFTTAIGRQLRNLGITRFEDSGFNTASDLHRFYSYRKEKGKTGRHFAAIQLPG
jgi:YfiH family protein